MKVNYSSLEWGIAHWRWETEPQKKLYKKDDAQKPKFNLEKEHFQKS